MKKHLFFLLLLFLPGAITEVTAQIRTITGNVVNKYDGDPVIGANVMVRGTTVGTITDFDGNFTLQYSFTENDILQVSYIGYRTQEIKIDSRSVYRIEMEEDAMTLDEVVVTGYGVVMKSVVTGVLASASMGVIAAEKEESKKSATTWKRSGLKDNSIRLQVGHEDFIPLEAAQMAVQIDGFRVRVLMDCFFYNDKKDGLEGTFKLKLPTDATPFYFAFGETEYLNADEEDEEIIRQFPYNIYDPEDFNLSFQDIEDSNERDWNRVKEARIVPKQKAAKAYEKTVSAAIDPALMEWGGADMFSCKVYPLSKNTLHRIVIGYDLNMVEALDFREYVMNLPKVEKELKLDMAVYNSPNMKSSVSPDLTANVIEEDHIYYSVVNPKEKEYVIRYDNVDPVLLVQSPYELSMIEDVNIPYFAATYRVDLPETLQEDLSQDAIFLLDVSISSSPDKFNVWLKLMEEILENNRDIIKRFSVLTFNIENRWYARHYLKNNYFNQQQVMEYLNTLALEGATDLASALEEASNPYWLRKGKNQPKHIFLLSDADCNWGETNMHKFKNLIYPGDRIHTYKTGLSGTNNGILNYLSRISNGFAFTVTGEEEAKLTATSFRYKPWDIEHIEMAGTEDFLISGQPIQLYNGQKLIFTGRDIPEGEICIDVNNGVEKRRLVYKAKEVIPSALVSRIYGQVAASYLENYGWHAEEAAISYSVYYRVPGHYTSLLMLEDEWDYDEWGIDDYDAENFVNLNLVTELVKELEENAALALLGDGKADFKKWLDVLDEELFYGSNQFYEYFDELPDDVFKVDLKSRHYNVWLAEHQDAWEKELLADEDIRYDQLYKVARKRGFQYGKPDALKLLSSVIERNASDFMAIRDVAMTALDWKLSDHAYYMMRRIIDGRQEEGLAYMTAADALAQNGNIELALIYYYICMDAYWDSDYGSLSSLAAFKCLRYINQLEANKKIKLSDPVKKYLPYFKEAAVAELESEGFTDVDEADIIIMVSWNLPDTDIDLHVLEPTGEKCYYGNDKTEIGGKLSIDVTDGYGPEMYVLKKAVKGKYSVILDYYDDSGLQTASKAKAYIDIYRNWGRKNEKLVRKVVELRRGDWEDDYEDDEEEDRHKTVMRFTVR